MNVNFAERAHNHNWKLDPIVRSLLDTDFYKLLMLQFIWKNFAATHVTSEVRNRTLQVRLAERIGVAALVEQMEHVRGLRYRRSELVWLAGNSFYGVRSIFEPGFLDWLEHDFRLSDYSVSEDEGQLVLRFEGLWSAVTMWEIYALAIVSELKTRAALAGADGAGAGRAVCAGEDAAVGQAGAAAGGGGAAGVGLRDAAAAQLSVAGVCGGGAEDGAGGADDGHLQHGAGVQA